MFFINKVLYNLASELFKCFNPKILIPVHTSNPKLFSNFGYKIIYSEEYIENETQIEDSIIEGRIEIMENALMDSKMTASRLSKLSGLSVEEIYEWYFKGKNGKYKGYRH